MGKDKQVEEALVKWFSRVRDQEACITQEMLLVKSEQLAKLLGHSNFKASRGCLYHMCKRSDMKHRKLREESASADLVARDKWLTKTWPTHRAKYAPEDIWNSNEGQYINDVRREGEGGG